MQLTLFDINTFKNANNSKHQILPLWEYDFILLAFSGGKDSLACFLLLLEISQQGLLDLGKVELHHHLVDGREGSRLFDWVCTESYCKAVAKAFGVPLYFSWLEGGFERELNRLNQPKAPNWFETPQGLKKSGGIGKKNTRRKFPAMRADLKVRWCSSYLKIAPFQASICGQSRFDGKKILVITGERAEESPNRARYAQIQPHSTSNTKRKVDHWRPVLNWSRREVWKLIEKWCVQVHPAYYLGFGRLSCKNCIFSSNNQLKTAQHIDPDSINQLIWYEKEFDHTIHDTKSLEERLKDGNIYPSVTQEMIEIATSDNYEQPIILSNWIPPSGMNGEQHGSF